jgi:hypothetical protein
VTGYLTRALDLRRGYATSWARARAAKEDDLKTASESTNK